MTFHLFSLMFSTSESVTNRKKINYSYFSALKQALNRLMQHPNQYRMKLCHRRKIEKCNLSIFSKLFLFLNCFFYFFISLFCAFSNCFKIFFIESFFVCKNFCLLFLKLLKIRVFYSSFSSLLESYFLFYY